MTSRARALASSLAILIVAVAAGVWQHTAARPKAVVESHRIDTQAEAPAVRPIGPTARQALERRAELGLTEAQIGRLEALDREWQRTGGTLEREVREAGADFQRFMDEARPAGRGNLTEIKARAAAQDELFAEYRGQRAAHVAGVRQVLTEEQRARWTVAAASQHAGEQR